MGSRGSNPLPSSMCLMCLKDDVFGPKGPSSRELLRKRAARIKSMITEAEANKDRLCYVGDAAVNLLKKEQYELARQL